MSDTQLTHDDHSCTDCPLVQRREFLGDAVRAVAAAMIAVGAAPARAFAFAGHMAPLVPAATGGREAAYAIPTQDGAAIDRDSEVILTRYDGGVYAFALSCPHQNTALRWEEGKQRFQCSKHHSKYRPDGTFIEGRATRGMDRYAIKREGDRIVVDLESLFEQDKDAAAWNAAVIRVA